MNSVYHLSPNEQAVLLRQKTCERRKSRLIRVREQEKAHARNLAKQSVLKRDAERASLEEQVRGLTESCIEAELRSLEEKYSKTLETLGQGQKAAQFVNDEYSRVQELRVLLTATQRAKARERHVAALKQRAAEQKADRTFKERALQRRKEARKVDRQALLEILPSSTSPHMLVLNLATEKGRKVKLKEVEGYSMSYYHIPDSVVERAGTEELSCGDAHQLAREVTDRDAVTEARSHMIRQEQSERSRLRHRQAMEKVKLEKAKDRVLAEIGDLEREDRVRRQKSLAKQPLGVFQPPQHRLQAYQEQQREMEQAFEGLCLQARVAQR